jgi:hypothetical protein
MPASCRKSLRPIQCRFNKRRRFNVMDKISLNLEVQKLIENLHLPEDDILEMFYFKSNNNDLTREEAFKFIHFLRSELDNRSH